jgi:hypothetical protein
MPLAANRCEIGKLENLEVLGALYMQDAVFQKLSAELFRAPANIWRPTFTTTSSYASRR